MSEPTRAGRADARANRERILTAARAVLRRRGFEAEVAEIAAEAGLGTGTLYRHFPNKEALILAVAREVQDRAADLQRAMVGVEDARDAVALSMQLVFQLVDEYGQFVIALFSGTAGPQYRDIFDESAARRLYGALFQHGIDQGHFRADLDVDHTIGVLFSLFTPHALGHQLETRPLEEVAALTTNFFLTGLGAQPLPPKPEAGAEGSTTNSGSGSGGSAAR